MAKIERRWLSRLEDYMKRTSQQVRDNGHVSASLSLELIGYIRELEEALYLEARKAEQRNKEPTEDESEASKGDFSHSPDCPCFVCARRRNPEA